MATLGLEVLLGVAGFPLRKLFDRALKYCQDVRDFPDEWRAIKDELDILNRLCYDMSLGEFTPLFPSSQPTAGTTFVNRNLRKVRAEIENLKQLSESALRTMDKAYLKCNKGSFSAPKRASQLKVIRKTRQQVRAFVYVAAPLMTTLLQIAYHQADMEANEANKRSILEAIGNLKHNLDLRPELYMEFGYHGLANADPRDWIRLQCARMGRPMLHQAVPQGRSLHAAWGEIFQRICPCIFGSSQRTHPDDAFEPDPSDLPGGDSPSNVLGGNWRHRYTQKYIYGMDQHVQRLKMLLMDPGANSFVGIIGGGGGGGNIAGTPKAVTDLGPDGGKTLGIAGMGGIGKTTLAKIINNDRDIQRHFKHGVFWVVVGLDMYSSRPKTVLKGLYTAVTSGHELRGTDDFEDGVAAFKRVIRGKSMLFVLDDVWRKESVEWIHDVIDENARVLMTTRNAQVLARPGVGVYNLTLLNDDDAMKLLCRHSFGDQEPPSHLKSLVKDVCKECEGLPLALKVIGSFMQGMGTQEWDHMLQKLRTATPLSGDFQDALMAKLRVSFTDLSDVLQDMFLDLAAYPEDSEISVDSLLLMWATDPRIADAAEARYLLRELTLRSLVSWDMMAGDVSGDVSDMEFALEKATKLVHDKNFGTCKVHDVLRDLALQIIRQGGPVSRRERLYLSSMRPEEVDDAVPVLSLNKPGTGFSNPFTPSAPSPKEILPKAVSFLGAGATGLTVDTIAQWQMPNAEVVLMKDEVGFAVSEKVLSGLCNPIGLSLLRVLDMPDSFILSLPDNISSLQHLRYLGLRNCMHLQTLPESISSLQKLQALDLQGCLGLQQVPLSLGSLKRLRWVCFSGNDFPRVERRLARSSSLVRTSSALGSLIKPSVETHFVDMLLGLPSLETLLVDVKPAVAANTRANRPGVGRPQMTIPTSSNAVQPHKLRKLVLLHASVEKLPESTICHCENLQVLAVDSRKVDTLPPALAQLRALRVLYISASSLTSLRNIDFGHLPVLENLELGTCLALRDGIESIANCSRLRVLRFKLCSQLTGLSTFRFDRLTSLQKLCLSELGDELNTLPRLLPNCQYLVDLTIEDSLTHFPAVARGPFFPSLTRLKLSTVPMQLLPAALVRVTSLETLTLDRCNGIADLEPLDGRKLHSLKNLVVNGCSNLTSLPISLQLCTTLSSIKISNCANLSIIPDAVSHLVERADANQSGSQI